ncbi:MAG TPA: hypothetical protein VLK88_13335 [Gemmatimonadales bacterium]|nr:hypothetical protein [Gemmatimonadales bacterium]
MKRSALLLGGLLLAAASTANAQLTMQMSNGWTFSFAGNVNIFAQYQHQESGGTTGSPGTLTGVGGKGFYYGTGLLPAFATFEAKGKEGNTDLGVHFGFAPEVQCGGGIHDCFGAQIDMRQVFLTIGGGWGQILAGKELGLFARGNILADQTLFGVGGGGIAPAGTTLGRIGYGYPYANFVGQITYSTQSGRPTQLSIGLMDPSALDGNYTQTDVPRLEGEFTWKGKNINLFLNGTVQNAKDPVANQSKTATGVGGGLTFKTENGKFSLTGTGYWGKGIGTTLQFSGVGPALGGLGVGADGELRDSYGGFAQATIGLGEKNTLAASYGSSFLQATSGEPDFKTENSLISGGLYHQATKSLKIVVEGNYMWSDDKNNNVEQNKAFTGAFGFMLFY